MKEKLRDNLLSVSTVVLVFFFLLLLGGHLGVGEGTDIYFVSVMIVAYLNQLVHAVWDAMQPYYVELKEGDSKSSQKLYLSLLYRIIFFSLLLIGLYYLLTTLFLIVPTEQKAFLDIYIFAILFQNILLFNKRILNLERCFASYYLVDIFIYSLNILVLLYLYDTQIEILAYSLVGATFLANLGQFFLLYKREVFSFRFEWKHNSLKEIHYNSAKMKFSSILYNTKEPLFAMIFLASGEGLYSLYSYAYKFAAAIFQVTNTPTINRYVTKINHLVVKQRYEEIENRLKKVLYETLPPFVLVTLVFYIIMPTFLLVTFGEEFSEESILTVKHLFVFMTCFYFVIALETPAMNNIATFKLFNYNLFVNATFSLFMLLIYLLYKFTSQSYELYLYLLIFAQAMNLFLFHFRSKSYIRSQL